jgi:hypothetical protein
LVYAGSRVKSEEARSSVKFARYSAGYVRERLGVRRLARQERGGEELREDRAVRGGERALGVPQAVACGELLKEQDLAEQVVVNELFAGRSVQGRSQFRPRFARVVNEVQERRLLRTVELPGEGPLDERAQAPRSVAQDVLEFLPFAVHVAHDVHRPAR